MLGWREQCILSHRQRMLKRTGGTFDLQPQLLNHGPGNESPELVTCHNAPDTSVGFLQCCEMPHSRLSATWNNNPTPLTFSRIGLKCSVIMLEGPTAHPECPSPCFPFGRRVEENLQTASVCVGSGQGTLCSSSWLATDRYCANPRPAD